MKKALALILSITMVLSLSTPVFAVEAEKNVGETVVLSSCTEEIVGADTEFVEYVDGEDYYTDYSVQVDDAYEMFERIGQMD